MFLLCFLLTFKVVRSDEEKDFWDELSDDEVVVEDKVEGQMYAKARFNLPIKRRLKLYPQVAKIVSRLQNCVGFEFIYESRIPKLIFLDSEDFAVETIDVSKMTEDEIVALLNIRGFKDFTPIPSEKKIQTQNVTKEVEDNNTTKEAEVINTTKEVKDNNTTKEIDVESATKETEAKNEKEEDGQQKLTKEEEDGQQKVTKEADDKNEAEEIEDRPL
ncbi:hypothetical protein GPJ56_009140 [Histomonas meleagridis]|uniref:uncharacterized protein n=1 Tax=Histomonas meleagridis TaxID=135588 RepID=UPI003559FF75|nr:hypothetical protein GPJ56_009140 [Histomonas meleagridis]KAH0799203.1 hypothetical protein GO595_008000 [Histomonas meleagridis]